MSKNKQLDGSFLFRAPPEAIWEALRDPVRVEDCLSGCERFVQTGPGAYIATAQVRLGPIRSRLAVAISIAETEPPRRGVVTLETSGAIGTIRVTADIDLTEAPGGTLLQYRAQALLGGRILWFAHRAGDDAVRELIDTFFRRLAETIREPDEAPATDQPPILPPPVPPKPKPVRRSQRTLWIGAGAAAATVLTATAAILWSRRGPR